MFEFDKPVRLPALPCDLTAVGELLIDMIAEDYSADCDRYRRYFGGSPANIAMNAARLGIGAGIVSAVGQDAMGDFLVGRVCSSGLDAEGVQRVPHSTSMVLVSRSVGTPVPVFYRDADFRITLGQDTTKRIQNSRILHFSSWPLSRQPARGAVEAAIGLAREQGALVGFDPNYHPMVWGQGSDDVAYLRSVIGRVDVVKPSEEDAERLFGPDTHENQIAKFLNCGAGLVVYTMGRDGAIATNGRETLKFQTMATEVVDTTGAGDAFWGGFYAALARGLRLSTALETGFAASAFKLKHVGAVAPLPALAELQRLYSIQTEG